MFKNQSGQKVTLLAFNTSTGAPVAGDAANLTAYVSKDDGTVTALADTSATEMDATNAKGSYVFDVAQAESNADKLLFTGKSVTANVVVVPLTIYTRPPNASSLSIDSNGRLDVIKVAGTTQTARDLGGTLGAAGAGLTALGDTRIANLDATISSRTKPADTQAAVTTVTNLTNAPSAGDFTATMKTSLNAATPAVTVSDKTGFALSAGGIQAIWDAATSALTTAGSIGKKLADWAILTSTTTADAVWNAVASSYNTALSMGNKLNSAASAGDPWTTAVPGAYGAGTAGKILGDNLNAAVSTRLATSGYTAPLDAAGTRTAVGLASANLDTQLDALPTNAELATALGTADDATLAAIAALNNLSAANIRTAIGLATANLDTQLTAISAKTGNLPSDPADASDVAAAFSSVASTLTTIGAYIDTEVAAIKAQTDKLTFDGGNYLSANLKKVNDVVLVGDGSSTPWGPS